MTSTWVARLLSPTTVDTPQIAAQGQRIPKHIAIIMDGNGRWAKQRLLPRTAGHREGTKAVRRVVQACAERGVQVLTLFAFSSENWRRPASEVSLLMDLFMITLRSEIKRLHSNNIRVRFIGDRQAFADKLQARMAAAEALTAHNTGLTVVIAANYGGQWDIAQAAQRLAEQVLAGQLAPQDISAERLGQQLSLADLPAPDLFIRTGGEQRISNFLLWQLAYTELYFTERYWPEFDAELLEQAIADYSSRERRFGQISEQLGSSPSA